MSLVLLLEIPGEWAYNTNKAVLNRIKSERNRHEQDQKAGGFFGLHMTLVLFQYRAY
jgi:hypothetical protein